MHNHDERKYIRQTVLVEARILKEGQWTDCSILNISAGGAKMVGCGEISCGTSVKLEVSRFGEFSGTVLWHNGQETGIRFDHDPDEMAAVVMGLATYG